MDVSLTLPELLALAAPNGLPPGIGTPTLVGDVLVVDVDPRALPDLPTAARLAARAAGTVSVRITVVGVVAGRATFDVAAFARGLPAHRLVGLVHGLVAAAVHDALVGRGIAREAVELVPREGRLDVIADTAALLAPARLPSHLRGLQVTHLALSSGRLHVTVALP
ncbi:hypothetical protein ACTVCO_06895 [Sanguibacter sp. A247]|uniref:hypothetical protein n=1 Tax=unclassified Sanguibacter TaxID=2645534 RepID=UPI003FD76ED6